VIRQDIRTMWQTHIGQAWIVVNRLLYSHLNTSVPPLTSLCSWHRQSSISNMDGLSVAASVAGLVQLSAKVISIISTFISTTAGAPKTARSVLAESKVLRAIFHQLQDFILNSSEEIDDRESIYVEPLVATLTGCVCSFNKLEGVLESLNTKPDAGSLLRLWDSTKWALKDSDISQILDDLQKHKSSLNLMMTTITWYIPASSQPTSG